MNAIVCIDSRAGQSERILLDLGEGLPENVRTARCGWGTHSSARTVCSLLGRKEARAQSLIYLNGLLSAPGRKSAEPMALLFGRPENDGIGQNQVLGLQRFLTYSPWEAQAVQREMQAVFAEELVPSMAD